MRRSLLSVLAVAGLAGASWIGVRGVAPVPPLGALLDPVNGGWGATRGDLPADAAAEIPNLSAPVEVRYDRRGVPHIFATTESDAIRALGFVVARDRLFQLEAQARAASGRLTEWAGAIALSADQEMRRLGLPASAEKNAAAIAPASRAQQILEAYADGVNAWIDSLRPAQLPVEYRLLGVRPERWVPVNTMHLFARMGWTLAFNNNERSQLAWFGGLFAASALTVAAVGAGNIMAALAGAFDMFARRCGRAVMWLLIVMALVQFGVVVLRYVFGVNYIFIQESVT
jgi:penicillin amidase